MAKAQQPQGVVGLLGKCDNAVYPQPLRGLKGFRIIVPCFETSP